MKNHLKDIPLVFRKINIQTWPGLLVVCVLKTFIFPYIQLLKFFKHKYSPEKNQTHCTLYHSQDI